MGINMGNGQPIMRVENLQRKKNIKMESKMENGQPIMKTGRLK